MIANHVNKSGHTMKIRILITCSWGRPLVTEITSWIILHAAAANLPWEFSIDTHFPRSSNWLKFLHYFPNNRNNCFLCLSNWCHQSMKFITFIDTVISCTQWAYSMISRDIVFWVSIFFQFPAYMNFLWKMSCEIKVDSGKQHDE